MGFSLKDAYGASADIKPAGEAAPVKPRGISLQDAYKPADKDNFDAGKAAGEFFNDPIISAGTQVGTRFLKGVGEIPGIPQDLTSLAATYAPGLGIVASPVQIELERRKKMGANTPAPLGSENFSRMEQDWLGLPKPAAPKNEAEKVLGNVSEFAGNSIGPGGITGDALKAALGGGTLLTGAQEIFPDSPLAQLTAAILGGHAPRAMAAAPGKIKAALAPALHGVTAEGIGSTVGKTLKEHAPTGTPASTAALQTTDVPGVQLSLGQAKDSDELRALEAQAAKSDPTLAAERERREGANAAATQTALRGLKGDGVPAKATVHAAGEVAASEKAAADARAGFKTGKPGDTVADISDRARQRLETGYQKVRTEEKGLWDYFRRLGEKASVNTKGLEGRLQSYLKAAGGPVQEIPANVKAFLERWQGKNKPNIAELQDLRSELGRSAREASSGATPNRQLARAYTGMQGLVDKFMGQQKFADPSIMAALKKAREFSAGKAERYTQAAQANKLFSKTSTGGDKVTEAQTLDTFIRPGASGRDTIRQLLDLDGSPEMQAHVADYLAARIPESASADKVRSFLNGYAPLIKELGRSGVTSWADRFERIAQTQAATEALRATPLGKLAGSTPEKVITDILKNEADPVAVAKTLRSQMAKNSDAWAGMKNAFAEQIIGKVTNAEGGIKPGALSELTQEQNALAEVFLGEKGAHMLREIDRAVRLTSGKVPAAGTLPSLTGHKFLDEIISTEASNVGGIATTGVTSTVGGVLGGPLGAVAGMGAGIGANKFARSLQQPLQDTLREAILNPEVGNALMHKASVKSMPAVPKELRPFLKDFLGTERGAVGATMGAPKPDKPKQKVSMAEPSQSMPDGMGFIRQPAQASQPQTQATGMGGELLPGQSKSAFQASLRAAGLPENVVNDPAAQWAIMKDGGKIGDKMRHYLGQTMDNVPPPGPEKPLVPPPPAERARLPAHEVSAEAFSQMDPQAQKHLLDALMTPGDMDLSDIERRRKQNVADEMRHRAEFGGDVSDPGTGRGTPNIKTQMEKEGDLAEQKAALEEGRSTGVGTGPGALSRSVTLPSGEDFAMLLKLINEANQRRLAAIAKNPRKPQPLGGMNRLDTR